MKARKFKNFPYIRCNVVFKKSLSLGSSLSNNSNNYITKRGKKIKIIQMKYGRRKKKEMKEIEMEGGNKKNQGVFYL